jgi:hypothetical protein
MDGVATRTTGADPFGEQVGERVLRRLAGAGVAVTIAGALAGTWAVEVLPWVLLGAAVVYLLGVPVSWLVVRRGGAPLARHVVAALLLALLVGAVLALLTDDGFVGWWAVYAMAAVGAGVPVAALAVGVGMALPDRWVAPVAGVGLLVAVVVLPAATWVAVQPPAPYDFVLVEEPELVRDRIDGAHALAEVLAARFDERAGAGEDRTAHATWVAITTDLGDRELDGVASWMRTTLDKDLPTLPGTDTPVRLVTTIFADEAARSCVVVTPSATSVEPRRCRDVELTG